MLLIVNNNKIVQPSTKFVKETVPVIHSAVKMFFAPLEISSTSMFQIYQLILSDVRKCKRQFSNDDFIYYRGKCYRTQN